MRAAEQAAAKLQKLSLEMSFGASNVVNTKSGVNLNKRTKGAAGAMRRAVQ